jgi:hypothetical protein
MEDLRFRNSQNSQPSSHDVEQSFPSYSTQRSNADPHQTSSSTPIDPRAALQRRFTTESARHPTLASIEQQRAGRGVGFTDPLDSSSVSHNFLQAYALHN